MRAGWGRPSATSGEDGGAGSRARDDECSPSPCWASAAWSARCSSARRASSPRPKRAGRRSSPPWTVGRSRSFRSRWTRGGSRRLRKQSGRRDRSSRQSSSWDARTTPGRTSGSYSMPSPSCCSNIPLRGSGSSARRRDGPCPHGSRWWGGRGGRPVPSRRDDLRPPVVAGRLRHRGGGSPLLRDPGRDDTLRWARGHRPTVGGRRRCDGVLRRGDGGRAPPPAREPGDAPGLQDVGSDLRRPGARAGYARAAARDRCWGRSMTDGHGRDRELRGRRAAARLPREPARSDPTAVEMIVVDASSTRSEHGGRRRARRASSSGANDGLGALYNAGARAASRRTSCSRTTTSRSTSVRRAPRRAARRGRARASPPILRQLDWSGATPDPRAHDALARAAPARVPARASTSTSPCRPTTVVPTVSRERRRDARPARAPARARRLRRDDVHGLGGHRPLLARLAARLAERLRARTPRAPPRRRRDDRGPCCRGGSSSSHHNLDAVRAQVPAGAATRRASSPGSCCGCRAIRARSPAALAAVAARAAEISSLRRRLRP